MSPTHGFAVLSIPMPKTSVVLSTTKAYWWPATTEAGDEKSAVMGANPFEAGANTLSVASAVAALSSGAPEMSSGRISIEKAWSLLILLTLTVAEVNWPVFSAVNVWPDRGWLEELVPTGLVGSAQCASSTSAAEADPAPNSATTTVIAVNAPTHALPRGKRA